MSVEAFPHALEDKTFSKEDFAELCGNAVNDPVLLQLLSESMTQGAFGNTNKVNLVNCRLLNYFYKLKCPEGFVEVPLDSIPVGCTYPNISETISSHLGTSVLEDQVTIVTVTCFNDITEPVDVMIPPSNVMSGLHNAFNAGKQLSLVSLKQVTGKDIVVRQKPLTTIASFKPDSTRVIPLSDYYDIIFSNSPDGTRERFIKELTPVDEPEYLKSPEQIVQEAIARQVVSNVPLGDLKEVIETEVSDVQQKEDS